MAEERREEAEGRREKRDNKQMNINKDMNTTQQTDKKNTTQQTDKKKHNTTDRSRREIKKKNTHLLLTPLYNPLYVISALFSFFSSFN